MYTCIDIHIYIYIYIYVNGGGGRERERENMPSHNVSLLMYVALRCSSTFCCYFGDSRVDCAGCEWVLGPLGGGTKTRRGGRRGGERERERAREGEREREREPPPLRSPFPLRRVSPAALSVFRHAVGLQTRASRPDTEGLRCYCYSLAPK